MRRLSLLTAVLLVLPSFGYDSPKEYDGTIVEDPLEGTWRLTEVAYNDRKYEPNIDEMVVTCRGAILTIKYSNGDTIQGNYRINTARRPWQLDWLPSKRDSKVPVPAVAIVRRSAGRLNWHAKLLCQIDGDMLRVAFLASDSERPLGFNDEGIVVHTYKRVK
jgi:uncharacterized protein (TIGR03067 family)